MQGKIEEDKDVVACDILFKHESLTRRDVIKAASKEFQGGEDCQAHLKA